MDLMQALYTSTIILNGYKHLSSNYDSVDSLVNSFTRNSVIAGFRGGHIWNYHLLIMLLKVGPSIYDTFADQIFNTFDDPNKKYIFISADNGAYGYFSSINAFKKSSLTIMKQMN